MPEHLRPSGRDPRLSGFGADDSDAVFTAPPPASLLGGRGGGGAEPVGVERFTRGHAVEAGGFDGEDICVLVETGKQERASLERERDIP